MTYERLTLLLEPAEGAALREAAKANLRRPPDQARYLLRSVLLGDREVATKNANGGAMDLDPQRAAVQK
jgi:hypothetical protein